MFIHVRRVREISYGTFIGESPWNFSGIVGGIHFPAEWRGVEDGESSVAFPAAGFVHRRGRAVRSASRRASPTGSTQKQEDAAHGDPRGGASVVDIPGSTTAGMTLVEHQTRSPIVRRTATDDLSTATEAFPLRPEEAQVCQAFDHPWQGDLRLWHVRPAFKRDLLAASAVERRSAERAE